MVLGIQPLKEVLSEERNVFAAIPKRRQCNLKYVDAVEKILPESALFDEFSKAPIAGGNETNVKRAGLVVSDAPDFSLLKDAE